MDRRLVSPQNSHIEILTPDAMAFGGGAFEKPPGHEDGALVSGVVERSATRGHSERLAISEPGSRTSPNTESAGVLIFDFQTLTL